MPRAAHRQLMYGGIKGVTANEADKTQLWPINDPDFVGAKWIDFYFYLASITGAPEHAKLQAKFQKAVASTTAIEWAVPVWQDFEDYDVTTRCLGGQAWGSSVPGGTSYARATNHELGTLHNSEVSGSMTLGYFVSARVEPPFGKIRTFLIPKFTGGTSPTYQVVGYYEVGYD
jgi:hypothetical protein